MIPLKEPKALKKNKSSLPVSINYVVLYQTKLKKRLIYEKIFTLIYKYLKSEIKLKTSQSPNKLKLYNFLIINTTFDFLELKYLC